MQSSPAVWRLLDLYLGLWVGKSGCCGLERKYIWISCSLTLGLSEDCSQVDKIITLPTVKPSLLPWIQATSWALVTNAFPLTGWHCQPGLLEAVIRKSVIIEYHYNLETERTSCQVWLAPKYVSVFQTAADERSDCFNDLQTAWQCWICSNVTTSTILQPLGGAKGPEKDFICVSGDALLYCTYAIYACACARASVQLKACFFKMFLKWRMTNNKNN